MVFEGSQGSLLVKLSYNIFWLGKIAIYKMAHIGLFSANELIIRQVTSARFYKLTDNLPEAAMATSEPASRSQRKEKKAWPLIFLRWWT